MLPARVPELSLLNTFLALARYTTPMGFESFCWPMIPNLMEVDEHCNAHVIVPHKDGTLPKTMFSSHLDTACSHFERVSFRQNKHGFIKTDGSTILGADCKIGAAMMIKMIHHGVPGWYVFHCGEEKGLVGSGRMAKDYKTWPYIPDRCVAFDRMGYQDVITHQMGSRCCSEEFAKALADALNSDPVIYNNYQPDPTGVYTDSVSYVGIIPECTNISVGYFNQHSHSECQDMAFAEGLLRVLLKIDWEALPTVRDPAEEEEDYGYYSCRHGWNSGATGGYTGSKEEPWDYSESGHSRSLDRSKKKRHDPDLDSEDEWRRRREGNVPQEEDESIWDCKCESCDTVQPIKYQYTNLGAFVCHGCGEVCDMFEGTKRQGRETYQDPSDHYELDDGCPPHDWAPDSADGLEVTG